MDKIKINEISKLIKEQIKNYENKLKTEEIGTVISVGDGICQIHGLDNAMASELLIFPNDVYGMVLNLEHDLVGAILFDDSIKIKEGDKVRLTGKVLEVPVGDNFIGRVIDPLGNPLDGKGKIISDKYRKIDVKASGVIDRESVNEPLQTGIKVIDTLVPIGRGQRELIIGDRQTGKTSLAIDTILNQKGMDIICIYVAIGQKESTVVNVYETLKKYGAMDYSIIVSASASKPAPLQYIAPYSGCAIAEEFMYSGKDVLIVYDDLTKHAISYRELALLLKRPPGREAYPGDVFYLHSRLLERSAKLNKKLGGGSITALPIIETQAGDISAYIPTNVISITDGQIYLQSDLFYSGVRPAINPGLSVSRVGGDAQTKAIKSVSGTLRLDLASFRELESFSQFGSDLDQNTKEKIERGKRTVEILKQNLHEKLEMAEECIIIFALVNGLLDDIAVNNLLVFEKELFKYINKNQEFKNLKEEIQNTKVLNNKELLVKLIKEFKLIFNE